MNRVQLTMTLAVLLPTASRTQTVTPPGDPYFCYKAGPDKRERGR